MPNNGFYVLDIKSAGVGPLRYIICNADPFPIHKTQPSPIPQHDLVEGYGGPQLVGRGLGVQFGQEIDDPGVGGLVAILSDCCSPLRPGWALGTTHSIRSLA